MPRITEERREANRAQIVAAARRCFSRDGFHQTSMPDIAAEAGVSVGAPYRYFSGKEEIILDIAGDAFRLIFDPKNRFDTAENLTVADLVAAGIERVGSTSVDRVGAQVPVEELLRCAVQAWSEILRREDLRRHAMTGFDDVRGQIADAVRAGQESGSVPPGVDPDRTARVVMALLHGFVLQRVAFDLVDIAGFVDDVRVLLGGCAR